MGSVSQNDCVYVTSDGKTVQKILFEHFLEERRRIRWHSALDGHPIHLILLDDIFG